MSWLVLAAALATIAGTLLLLFPSAETVLPLDETQIESRIRNLQTIATTEYRYRDVIYFGEESRFFGIPAGSRRILFSVDIAVLAGVDLNRGVDVQVDLSGAGRGDQVFVTLPAPQVIRVDAEERSISQYFVQERFGRLDWVAVSDEVEAAKDRNRRDAIERGILLRAEQQARVVVTRLLHAGGFSAVRVRFRPDSGGLTG